MTSYGSDYTARNQQSGDVVADGGATLLSPFSEGETAIMAGAALLREIQAGVANSDWSVSPQNPTANITAENNLPYWTVTTTGSGVTAAIVSDSSQASGNALRITVATSSSGSLTLSRFISIPGSRGRTFSLHPLITLGGATNCTDAELYITGQQFDSTYTSISGTTVVQSTYQFNSYTGTETALLPDTDQQTLWNDTPIASNAAYYKISITVQNAGTPAGDRIIDIYDVRLITGSSDLMVVDGTAPDTYGPAWISADSGVLSLQAYVASNNIYKLQISDTAISIPGPLQYRGLSGASMQLGGTNNRIWSFSNSSGAADICASVAGTRAGILVTKSLTGQPTSNVNGTGTADAFADAVRNGGLALDNGNQRLYCYSTSAWRYAALTNPSDSRLKEQITEISGALDTLRQLMPVAFKWKARHLHQRNDSVEDDGTRLGFIADQVATTDLKHWVETMNISGEEAEIATGSEAETPVLAVNIPQNEMEALVVQALLDIDARLKALESR